MALKHDLISYHVCYNKERKEKKIHGKTKMVLAKIGHFVEKNQLRKYLFAISQLKSWDNCLTTHLNREGLY